MLMRFSISNFMSFGCNENEKGEIIPQEFHLYAGRSEHFKNRVETVKERKVLKFSALYGANAAGKTNLIHAIDCGRKILLSTLEGGKYRELYCRNRKSNQAKPTLFEYEFTIAERCFAYGFTVNLYKECVLSEWLYELDGKDEKVIFERVAEQNQYYFDEDIFKDSENVQQFHFFIKDVNRVKGSLLLYEMNRRRLEEKDFQLFAWIFDWFRLKLTVIYPETHMGSSIFWFGKDNKELTNILDYLDTGITGYEMKNLTESAFKEYFPEDSLADQLLKHPDRVNGMKVNAVFRFGGVLFEIFYGENKAEKIRKLMFQHGTDETSYEFGEESDGTQRLIELMDIFLKDDEEHVYVVDELDRSLHPQMTIKFVETFLKLAERKNAQLIITTHESALMDLKILRRDEIWFAERENDNTTSLYTLDKFKIRYDKVVSRDYLAGRYGAVPIFKDFDYAWGEENFAEVESENAEKL